MKFVKIKKIEEYNEEHCYDFKVDKNNNFFLSNRILTHNSGKNKGINFLLHLVHLYNKKVAIFNSKNFKKLKIIRVKDISKTSTSQSFINRYNITEKLRETGKVKIEDGQHVLYDKKNKRINPVKGIFSTTDLIVAKECSFIFFDKDKSEDFLSALEGEPIIKSLVGWSIDGIALETQTVFNGVFFGASRPIENMKAHLAYSGLQQRGLNLCRKLSNEDREIMRVEKKRYSKMTNEEWSVIEKSKDKLIDDFVALSAKLSDNVPFIKDDERDEIVEIVDSNIALLQKEINEEFNQDLHRDVLQTFVSRYYDHADSLAFHNALSRKSEFINKYDYQNALKLLIHSFNELKFWVEETVHGDWYKIREEQSRVKKVRDFLNNAKFVLVADFPKRICKILGLSANSVYRLQKKWLSAGVMYELIDNNGKKYFSLNKDFFRKESNNE